MFFAVDIGATNSRWAVLRWSGKTYETLEYEELATASIGSAAGTLARFFARLALPIEAVAIGVAGPVLGRTARLTNLGLEIRADELEGALGCRVHLLNDMEAQAHGLPALDESGRVLVKEGSGATGNIALLAAGTGLGEAVLAWDATHGEYLVVASEGGHATFGPVTEEDIRLTHFLRQEMPHVSWERVLSGGLGLRNLYRFVVSEDGEREPELAAKLSECAACGPVLFAAARAGNPVASRVLDLFLRLYAAEAGNMALRSVATGGVYLAGGIAPKLLPLLSRERFRASFCGKGRMAPFLEQVPVYVVTDKFLALKGAAECARRRSVSGAAARPGAAAAQVLAATP